MRILAADVVRDPSVWALTLRVLVAAALGGLIGVERELRGQPAGLRTHLLVSVGATLFTLTGVQAAAQSGSVDPTRIAAQVVTGIGFLGAGAIIQQGLSVRGLTTAASLWVTAAVGTAVGLGYYAGGLLAAGVTVVSLVAFKRLERLLLPRVPHVEREVVLGVSPAFQLADVVGVIQEHGGRVIATRLVDQGDELQLNVAVRAHGSAYVGITQALIVLDGVHHVEWTR